MFPVPQKTLSVPCRVVEHLLSGKQHWFLQSTSPVVALPIRQVYTNTSDRIEIPETLLSLGSFVFICIFVVRGGLQLSHFSWTCAWRPAVRKVVHRSMLIFRKCVSCLQKHKLLDRQSMHEHFRDVVFSELSPFRDTSSTTSVTSFTSLLGRPYPSEGALYHRFDLVVKFVLKSTCIELQPAVGNTFQTATSQCLHGQVWLLLLCLVDILFATNKRGWKIPYYFVYMLRSI